MALTEGLGIAFRQQLEADIVLATTSSGPRYVGTTEFYDPLGQYFHLQGPSAGIEGFRMPPDIVLDLFGRDEQSGRPEFRLRRRVRVLLSMARLPKVRYLDCHPEYPIYALGEVPLATRVYLEKTNTKKQKKTNHKRDDSSLIYFWHLANID